MSQQAWHEWQLLRLHNKVTSKLTHVFSEKSMEPVAWGDGEGGHGGEPKRRPAQGP
jgi:hypothetical protein